jgi:hypothetical protein
MRLFFNKGSKHAEGSMGLFDLFGKRSSGKEETQKDGGSNQPTAVHYVDWLLNHMLSTSRMEIVVDSSRPLPGSEGPETNDPPPCMPDARSVINRLKLLSGVNPVAQSTAIEGRFERPRAHHTVFVVTKFLDAAGKSTCSIRLRIRA